MIFQPYPGGLTAQRFFHIQEEGSDNRLLFETRLTDDDEWFLDTCLHAGDDGHVLFAEDFKHAIGPWYHAAVVVGDGRFRHYVNGELELETDITFAALKRGWTSVGVRINRECWYKGAMRTARFSPRVLTPSEFFGG